MLIYSTGFTLNTWLGFLLHELSINAEWHGGDQPGVLLRFIAIIFLLTMKQIQCGSHFRASSRSKMKPAPPYGLSAWGSMKK